MTSKFHLIAFAVGVCFLSAGRCAASPTDVCALLTPFLDKPPSHFNAMRGVKTSDKAWNSKANAQADALNASCNLTAYVDQRLDYDCKIPFEPDAIEEQRAAYTDAVVGLDYCMGSLNFGDQARRSADKSWGGELETESVSWWRDKLKDGLTSAQFGATVSKTYGSSPGNKYREITIQVFFYQKS